MRPNNPGRSRIHTWDGLVADSAENGTIYEFEFASPREALRFRQQINRTARAMTPDKRVKWRSVEMADLPVGSNGTVVRVPVRGVWGLVDR